MIHLCLFGVSAGLEVKHLALTEGVAPRYEDSWIEISTRNVNFEGDIEIFSIFRRRVLDQLVTWIGVYRPAREIHLNRPGGYYGAGVWLVDCTLPGRIIKEIALSLADQVRDAAISGGRFVRPLSELNLAALRLPVQPATLLKECVAIQSVGGIFPGGSTQLTLTDTKSLSSILDWAQLSRTAEFFGSVLIVPAEKLLPVNGQNSNKNKIFNSIPSAIEYSYGERVRMYKQATDKSNQGRDKLETIKAELAEQLRHSDDYKRQLADFSKKNQQLQSKLDSIQAMSINPPFSQGLHAHRGSWFERNLIRNWRLIAVLTATSVALGVATFMLIQRICDDKHEQSTTQSSDDNSPPKSQVISEEKTQPPNAQPTSGATDAGNIDSTQGAASAVNGSARQDRNSSTSPPEAEHTTDD